MQIQEVFGGLLQALLLAALAFGSYSFFRTRNASVSEKKSSKKRVNWTALEAVTLTISFFLVSQIVAGLAIVAVLGLFNLKIELLSANASTVVNFIVFAMSGVLTLLFVQQFMKRRQTPWRLIGLKKIKLERDALHALVGYGVYFVTYLLTISFVIRLLPFIDIEQKQELGFSTSIGGASLILVFVCLVILPPIVEEILSRGFLYTGLRTKLSYWPAAIVTSVLFGIAHLQIGSGNPLLWIAAIDTFILSMVLVHLREKTGSLWSPILLHGIKNAVAFFVLFIVPKLQLVG